MEPNTLLNNNSQRDPAKPRYRVVQWATGTIGTRALRGVIEHPDLELVGLLVHSPDKAGLAHLGRRRRPARSHNFPVPLDRIGGPALRGLNWSPGQQIRIATGDPNAEGIMGRIGDLRTYSVWHYDPDAAEIHICVMDHGEGPGAVWGREAKPGLAVRFRGPEGSFTLRPDAPYHLFRPNSVSPTSPEKPGLSR